jgi:hypothetical protein
MLRKRRQHLLWFACLLQLRQLLLHLLQHCRQLLTAVRLQRRLLLYTTLQLQQTSCTSLLLLHMRAPGSQV